MEDILYNKIDRESLKPGDHIYAYRLAYTYSHHGIYIGEDRVIHYNRTQGVNRWNQAKPCGNCELDRNLVQGVVKSCVDCFLQGHSICRFRYGISFSRYLSNWHGTCTTGKAVPPEAVISSANALLLNKEAGFGDYNLFENNCEVFAVFCKTNKKVTYQARAAKLMLKACVKLATDRLLEDVKVHYGQEKHDELKRVIDGFLTNVSSLKEFIAKLKKDKKDTMPPSEHED